MCRWHKVCVCVFADSIASLSTVNMTLDVDTANNYLVTSEGLKRVHCGLFNYVICVLGTPRFSSGHHYWEVDVATSKEWNVGICKESVPRQDEVVLSSELGFWIVSSKSKDIFSASTVPLTVLTAGPLLMPCGSVPERGYGDHFLLSHWQ